MANCNTIYARITLTFMFPKFIQVGLYLRGRYNTGKGGEGLIFGMLNGLHIWGAYIPGGAYMWGDVLIGFYGMLDKK